MHGVVVLSFVFRLTRGNGSQTKARRLDTEHFGITSLLEKNCGNTPYKQPVISLPGNWKNGPNLTQPFYMLFAVSLLVIMV